MMKKFLEHPYGYLIWTLFFLCIVDLLFIFFELEMGWVYEFNPILTYLYDINIYLFGAAKLFLIGFGCSILWKYQERSLAKFGIIFLFVAYSILNSHHIIRIVDYSLSNYEPMGASYFSGIKEKI